MFVGYELLLLRTQCSAYCRFYSESVFWFRGVNTTTNSPPLTTHIFMYIYIQNITGTLSPEEKQLEREAGHSPSSSDEIQMSGVSPPLPHTP